MDNPKTRQSKFGKTVWFPDWLQALERIQDEEKRRSYEITVRWYLGWCKRQGAAVSIASALEFLLEVGKEKSPPDWALESWKEALRWFFKTAKTRPNSFQEQTEEIEVHVDKDQYDNPWELALVKAVRRRNLMLRTEQAYLR